MTRAVETRAMPRLRDALRENREELERKLCHVFDDDMIKAVDFALTVGRPLLVRGEPGIGKSQLARAVADALEWPLVCRIVDAHTEVRDLLYEVDAVRRLADAQIMGQGAANIDLGIENYVAPGELWWALGWDSAVARAKAMGRPVPHNPRGVGSKPAGVVVLIDEVDKSDPSVPNGLLGPLANRRFTTPSGQEIVASDDIRFLVVFTTNEDRALSDAFVRRCLVLPLSFPTDSTEQKERLKRLASLHCRGLSEDVVTEATKLLLEGRRSAKEADVAAPGYAEFVDLLRAVAAEQPEVRLTTLERLHRFVFYKHGTSHTRGSG